MISKTTLWFCVTNIFIITATNGQQHPSQPVNSICTVSRRIPGRKSLLRLQECCPGYKQDLLSVSLKCDPICSPSCGPHEICTAPDQCTCDVGFMKVAGFVSCEPHCPTSCINGSCIEPDVCQCYEGYHKTSNHTCAPTCYGGCENGSCVAPNECQLHTGSSDGNWTENSLDNFNNTNISRGNETYSTNTSITAQDHGFNFMYVWAPIVVILLVVIAVIVFGCRRKLFNKVCTRVETYDPNETNTASDNVCVKFSDLPISHQDELTKM